MSAARTNIERIRRRDLVEAAYLTFLEHGMQGMTMARIGERAGMSHGIVNYYFKSKDELLSAVVRHAGFLVMQDTLQLLKQAATPRARVSALIAGNFPNRLFTREIARARVSYYAAIGQNPGFERLQAVLDRRLASNLVHALKQLTGEQQTLDLCLSIVALIDGLWLRHAKSHNRFDAAMAIRHIEDFIDRGIDGTRSAQ
jgi:TetR/AcrR family transcriptional repressor of bet genes